ncbi:MAG: aldehyde dehydrogenase family protein [Armatimonadota bacterium]|nr:aldehyde dehydrogenase family protein [Armatimonadota bacterium]
MRLDVKGNQELRMYIGGQWVEASSGARIVVTSPVTGEQLAVVPRGTREDIGRAVRAARHAQPGFAAMTAFERRDLCHAIARAITRAREALAAYLTLEQGKPYHSEALAEVDVTARMFSMAAEDITRLEAAVIPSADRVKRILTIRQPRGVYGIITPWNFPLAIPAEYLSAGLAAGNAIVWVPAPTTAGCAVKLMECIVEAGVPEGIVNLVTGEGAEVGDELAGHPEVDAIGFTGSSFTGRLVSCRAAGKPQLLELGGNSPTIVLEDADVSEAARRTGRGAFRNAGQICDSTERILVHRRVHDRFVEALLEVAACFRLGDPREPETTLGPLNNERPARQMDRHIEDAIQKGARVLIGGRPQGGFPTRLYYPATVVDEVRPHMLLNLEETFGPVAPVMTFDDEEEAISIANGVPSGLVAALFTRDLGKAFRIAERLQAGIVNVNESTAYWQPHTPFGGYSGKSSGVGRLGGKYTLLEMTQIKTLVIDVG